MPHEPDNRQIIRDMLAPTDYEITEAENGEEALAAIAGRSQTRGLVQCTNVMASLAPAARVCFSEVTSSVHGTPAMFTAKPSKHQVC